MRFKIDRASLIVGRKFTVLALFYFVFEGNSKYKPPPGGLYLEGDLTEGFCATSLGGLHLEGLIHEGLIFGILRYLRRRLNRGITIKIYKPTFDKS